MAKILTVQPAYGRNPKTAKAAKADFQANKDWIVADFMHPYSGKPVNKEQLAGYRVTLRFNNDRTTAVVDV